MHRICENDRRVIYRVMELKDLDEVLEIERESFLAPWTPDLFIREFTNLRSKKRVVCNEEDGRLLGYIMWWITKDQSHLMNVAVNPEDKRKGYGRLLMNQMIEECRSHDIARITLEVRPSNIEAIQLYQDLKFSPVGLRYNYYVEEGEDAILMELDLK